MTIIDIGMARMKPTHIVQPTEKYTTFTAIA